MGVGPLTRAVFLDRDGVLNRALIRDGRPYPPPSLAEMELTPGVEESLAELKKAGFLLIVVTNQPDVSRGKQTREAVEAIHEHMTQALPIDVFRTCYHDDREDCACRKPKPGLLVEAAAEFGVDLATSYMVGDRWRDVDAGAAAGCRTVWIDYGYAERGPSKRADAVVRNIAEAAAFILKTETKMNQNVGEAWMQVADTERIVIEAVAQQLKEKGEDVPAMTAETALLGGNLAIDSLDLAVIVVRLGETTGKDPFQQGFIPFQTIGELAGLYAA